MVDKRRFSKADLIQIIRETTDDLFLAVTDLRPDQPQSLDNDFSVPLTIVEGLSKACEDLMNVADEEAA